MKTILEIQNLKCGGCENTIKKKLGNLDFINHIEVNNQESTVTLEHNKRADIDIVKRKLAKLGYPVTDDINNLKRKAKSLVSCAIGRIKNQAQLIKSYMEV